MRRERIDDPCSCRTKITTAVRESGALLLLQIQATRRKIGAQLTGSEIFV